MSDGNRRNGTVLLMLAIVGILVSVFYALSNATWTQITPLFNLPTAYHFLLVALVIPIIGCMITALVMPRILVPIFMVIKKVAKHKYRNAYVQISYDRLSLRRWIRRAFLLSLLILGLIAAVVGIIDPRLFMTPEEYTNFLAETGVPQFAPPVTITIAGLIAPLAFGILATAWIMEDAGLIHYYLPEDRSELYEVEPVYKQFSNYIKGYAGLSSILFIISVAFIFLTSGGNYESAIFTLLVPFFSILQMIPGYLVYSRLGTDYLRKGLPLAGHLRESDLQLLSNE